MTDRARLVIAIAEERASRLDSRIVLPEHLLFALAAEGGGIASHVLQHLGSGNDFIQSAIAAGRLGASIETMGAIAWDDGVKQIVTQSHAEAQQLMHSYPGTEHLLLAIATVQIDLCKQIGIRAKEIRAEIYSILGHDL